MRDIMVILRADRALHAVIIDGTNFVGGWISKHL
jgi:hypothetical protein